jgi:hypothetical protein
MENVMKEHGPKCISSLNNIVVSVAPSVPEKPKEEAPVKEKKKRCGECHKKLGLIAFPCKCGGEYCALHRNNADHNCSFDFHADAKNALSTMLVKVEAKKLEVI